MPSATTYRAALDYRREAPDSVRLAALTAFVRGHADHYDLIYRTALDPAIPLGSNKPRDTNGEFRALADRRIANVLDDLGLAHVRLPADGHDLAVDQAVALATVNRDARSV
jgi:hypothetical protein